MQDRIKELAIEAGFSNGHALSFEDELERFAKAVARDCFDLCQGVAGCTINTHKERDAAKYLAGQIRARFGIAGE